MRRVLLLVLAGLLWVASASAKSSPVLGTQTMDDGVSIATALYEPAGAPPAGGWPAVMVLHGLGGNKESLAPIAMTFADAGFAVEAFDARGHGASGGVITLDGPREVADIQALFRALAARPEVSDAKIGCWGISLGGGGCWNSATSVPWAAIEVVETWTDLYSALWPQNIAKSGIVLGLAKSVEAKSPLIAGLEADAVHSTNLGPVRATAAERSVFPQLGSLKTPVYLFQGRKDYVFDITQATQAYARLAGPKKLYVGQFGHPPSTFPGPDIGYVLSQGTEWFDRFLKGTPNGIDTSAPVTLAAPSGSARASYAGLPPTRTLVLRPGSRLHAGVQTFGVGTVTVDVTKLVTYPRLVATVSAGETVVTHGAVVPHLGRNTIRLANYAVSIPKGAKISVRLGPDSGPADIAYLGFGDSGGISTRTVTLKLSVLGR